MGIAPFNSQQIRSIRIRATQMVLNAMHISDQALRNRFVNEMAVQETATERHRLAREAEQHMQSAQAVRGNYATAMHDIYSINPNVLSTAQPTMLATPASMTVRSGTSIQTPTPRTGTIPLQPTPLHGVQSAASVRQVAGMPRISSTNGAAAVNGQGTPAAQEHGDMVPDDELAATRARAVRDAAIINGQAAAVLDAVNDGALADTDMADAYATAPAQDQEVTTTIFNDAIMVGVEGAEREDTLSPPPDDIQPPVMEETTGKKKKTKAPPKKKAPAKRKAPAKSKQATVAVTDAEADADGEVDVAVDGTVDDVVNSIEPADSKDIENKAPEQDGTAKKDIVDANMAIYDNLAQRAAINARIEAHKKQIRTRAKSIAATDDDPDA